MFKFFLRTDLRLNPLTTKRGGNETNKPKKKKKKEENGRKFSEMIDVYNIVF